MRHYEIVFLVHPDQSEQVPAMVDRYKSIVTAGGGQVHRHEDWGRRQLAHTIAKLHKAHYVLMNIECDNNALDEILGAFKFNDAVLRHLVIKRDEAISEPSLLAKPEGSKSEDNAPRAAEPTKETEIATPQAEAAPAAQVPAAPPADVADSAEAPVTPPADVADSAEAPAAVADSDEASPTDSDDGAPADADADAPEADSDAAEDKRAAQ